MTISAISEPRTVQYLRRLPRPAVAPILVAAAYYLGAEAAFAIGTLTQQFAPFWPPNVVLLCALLWAPRRHWPIYIGAVFPAHVLAELGVAMPLPQLLAAFGCNVSVAVLNALALLWLLRGPPWLTSLRNAFLYLLTAVILIPAVVALAAGFEPMLGDGDPSRYWQFWARWYLSNALGNLTLAPIALAVLSERPRRPLAKSRRQVFEAAILAAALLASCSAAFDTKLTQLAADFAPAMLYLPVPLLVAIAVRFGAKGAGAGILVVTVMVLFGAMHSHGPFAGVSPDRNVLSVQLFLAVVAIPTILLAALVEELRRTNDRLSAVLDGISDCYYTLDRSGRITSANAIGAAWMGASKPADLIGQDYWEIARDRPEKQAWVQRSMQEGVAARGEVQSSNGRWVDVHAYPVAGGVSIFYHDISERRAAERAARETQTLLQSSLDALNAHIAILDSSGTIIATNAAWQQVAALVNRSGEPYLLIGSNYLEVSEQTRPHHRMIAAGLRQLIRGEVEEFRCEFASAFFEGSWFQMRGTRFGVGDDLRLVVAHEDITDIKASESAMRRLTAKLLRSQDDERRRIARELHDSTAQNLLGASLGISQALRLVPRLKRTAKAALEESRSLIDESQREIRTVSYLLHPPMLDVAGLPVALRWLCEGFGRRTDMAVELQLSPDIQRLPDDLEAALFRIAQEGLTNVHRHAGGTMARVSLKLAPHTGQARDIALEIEDNGKGMPNLDQVGVGSRGRDTNNMGVGLAGMRERLHQFGGRMEIRSGPQGTVVQVSVPLPVDYQNLPEQTSRSIEAGSPT